jgi:hypothetical protein
MKVLSQLVEQFRARHHKMPSRIVVDPLALVSLGLRRSIAPVWNGIPVECREINPAPLQSKPTALGVCVQTDPQDPKVSYLQGFELCLP